jgi:hypothetical protein
LEVCVWGGDRVCRLRHAKGNSKFKILLLIVTMMCGGNADLIVDDIFL